ncbi:MAG: hypothetical protein FJZ63_02570 [Chlamydiae bacterium]|nr:hypothetical protein [Chlamydiota bacterium]
MRRNFCFFFILMTLFLTPSYGMEAPRTYSFKERQLLLDLYGIGIVTFNTENLPGSLPLDSPYYIDLRHVISHPTIFKEMVLLLKERAQLLSFDAICGVPYAALPMATGLAYETSSPLLMRRSSPKSHGTCKKIEGTLFPHMRCLVVEDVITTATSLFETIQDLEEANVAVAHCLVFFDREQGGLPYAKAKGYPTEAIFTLSDLVYILQEAGKISASFADYLIQWTRENQVPGINWKTKA